MSLSLCVHQISSCYFLNNLNVGKEDQIFSFAFLTASASGYMLLYSLQYAGDQQCSAVLRNERKRVASADKMVRSFHQDDSEC